MDGPRHELFLRLEQVLGPESAETLMEMMPRSAESPMSGTMNAPPAPNIEPTRGPIGQQRNIGKQVLLSVVTLGLYSIYWAYQSHEDIYQHTRSGITGVVGVLIAVFVGFVMLFLLPIEVKRMYEADGQTSPVGPATAFWILLFAVPWYVKCQSALNQYWASKGAPAAV
jgi:hypothetical protein